MCKAEHNVKVATIVLNKVSTTYKNEKANSKLFAAMVKASAEAAGAGFDVKAQVGDSALKEQWTTEEVGEELDKLRENDSQLLRAAGVMQLYMVVKKQLTLAETAATESAAAHRVKQLERQSLLDADKAKLKLERLQAGGATTDAAEATDAADVTETTGYTEEATLDFA